MELTQYDCFSVPQITKDFVKGCRQSKTKALQVKSVHLSAANPIQITQSVNLVTEERT